MKCKGKINFSIFFDDYRIIKFEDIWRLKKEGNKIIVYLEKRRNWNGLVDKFIGIESFYDIII